jgi:hypothetical protein
MLLFEHYAMRFIYVIVVYVSSDPGTYIVRIRFAFWNRVWQWWQPEKVSPPTRPSAPSAAGPSALWLWWLVLAPRVETWVRASSQQRLPWGHRCCCLAAQSGGRCRCWCSGCRWATWSLLSHRPSGVEVVHTRGSGTGVPFVRGYTGFLPEQNVTASRT